MSGPSNRWEALDPRAPVLRADDLLRHVGPGWAETGKADRTDPTFHQPLPAAVPIFRLAGEVPPPPPPPPSELELRDRLRTALAAELEATTKHDNATQAHQRAQALVESRKAAVEAFSALDTEIDTFTVEALRGDGKADLPDELRQKRADRDHAVAALASAERAEKQLAADLTVACSQRDARYRATHATMLPLLGIEAEKITRGIRDHERAIVRDQSRLIGFDMAAANHPGTMPADVHDYIFTRMHRRVATPAESKPWQDACERLRADPNAAIEIADPLPPAPVPIEQPHQQAVVAAAFARMAQAKAEREAAAAQTEGTDETKPPEAA
jgi:hypothetical protein